MTNLIAGIRIWETRIRQNWCTAAINWMDNYIFDYIRRWASNWILATITKANYSCKRTTSNYRVCPWRSLAGYILTPGTKGNTTLFISNVRIICNSLYHIINIDRVHLNICHNINNYSYLFSCEDITIWHINIWRLFDFYCPCVRIMHYWVSHCAQRTSCWSVWVFKPKRCLVCV